MEIISHRGNGFDYPENSLPAFSKALKNGFSIELDIHLSKDGVPFIIHDKYIDDILNGTGDVASFDSKQLKKFCYKKDKSLKLVEFKEVIELFESIKDPSANIFVHIQDINEKGVIENILRLIQNSKHNERFYLFAVDEMSFILIEEIKKNYKKIKVGLHLPENSKYFDEVNFKKADFIWVDEMNGKWFSEEMVDLAHCLKKKIYAISPELMKDSAYYNNYKERARDINEFGFDGICTDFPLRFERLLKG